MAEVSTFYRGRRVLVLGATGFLGRWVARALSGQHADVVLAARSSTDLEQPGNARALIADVGPSITFNLAGYGVDPAERDPDRAERVNHLLVRELCESIPDGSSLIHVGSALEYGTAAGDLNENTPPEPGTLYGRTKLAGTRALAEIAARRRLFAITARLFTVYGPGEIPGRLLPSLIEAARTGSVLALSSGIQKRDFTYARDVAEGLLRLGASLPRYGDSVNLATGELHSVREFAELAADCLGMPRARLEFGALPTRPEEMEHEPVAIARLRSWLDWTPPTRIAEGIRATIASTLQEQVHA